MTLQVHHHPGGNDLKEVSTIKFDFVGKTPGKHGMTPSSKVFRFTGNKVTTVMKSTVKTGGQSSVNVPRTGGYGTGKLKSWLQKTYYYVGSFLFFQLTF